MGIIRLAAGALLVGIDVWLAGAAFEPIARDGRAIEYVLVSPSFGRFVVCVARPAGGQNRFQPRWAFAAVALVPIASAVAFTPGLRFSGALHGDEPKYIRYAENFYQG